MPAKVMVSRTDHTPGHLRELARKHRFRDRRRRLRAIALVMEDGLSRAAVASGAGVGVRTLRDRVVRYNADGLDGLRDAARPGAPPKLVGGPRRPGGIPKGFRPVGAGGGARRGGPGGCARLPAGRGAGGAEGHALQGPGQEGDAPARRAGPPVRTPVPVPPACPATGDAVGHVCGRASTAETDRHLRETGERVPTGKRALVVPGGAGSRRSGDLGIPVLRLPPCSPELNPVETVFSVPGTGTSPTGCPEARSMSGRPWSGCGTPSSARRGRSRGSPRGNGRCREIRGAYRQ